MRLPRQISQDGLSDRLKKRLAKDVVYQTLEATSKTQPLDLYQPLMPLSVYSFLGSISLKGLSEHSCATRVLAVWFKK